MWHSMCLMTETIVADRIPHVPLDLTAVRYRRSYQGSHEKELQIGSRSCANGIGKEVGQYDVGSCDGKESRVCMPDKWIE